MAEDPIIATCLLIFLETTIIQQSKIPVKYPSEIFNIHTTSQVARYIIGYMYMARLGFQSE